MKRLKKSEHKKAPYILVGLLLVVVLALAAIGIFGGGESAPEDSLAQTEETESAAMELGNDLSLIQVGRYSGMYVEDGSDEIVQDILAITVENTGEQTVQLATVNLTAASGESYAFELTTLPPGEKMAVLEQNRAVFDAEMEIAVANSSNVAKFSEEPSMHEELLEFSCADRSVTVKNISGQDFSGGRVFYKNLSGETLVGGITYMLTIPALSAGQEVTLAAGHYMDGGSRLMFVTYAE